jgi:biopolymer transport protein ExbD
MKIKLDNDLNQTPRVEVIPLIDIIFCILTFFLLSGIKTAQQQSLNVDIPAAQTAVAEQTRDILIVSLDANGQAFIEQQPVPQLEVLLQQIKSYRVTKPNGSIVLYASKQVKYERVIEILDLLRQAGGENVALATVNEPTATNPSGAASPTPAGTASPSPPVSEMPAPFNLTPTPPAAMPTFSPAPGATRPSLVPTTPPAVAPSPARR